MFINQAFLEILKKIEKIEPEEKKIEYLIIQLNSHNKKMLNINEFLFKYMFGSSDIECINRVVRSFNKNESFHMNTKITKRGRNIKIKFLGSNV